MGVYGSHFRYSRTCRKYKYNNAILQHWVEKEWCQTASKLSKQGERKDAAGYGDSKGNLSSAKDFIPDMNDDDDANLSDGGEMKEEA